jgi:hypothetical protein
MEGDEKIKNVYTGKNPDTGRRYFDRKKVVVANPNHPPKIPPDEGLITEEESRKQMLEKAGRDWDNATSRDGRPPIGGAQDD